MRCRPQQVRFRTFCWAANVCLLWEARHSHSLACNATSTGSTIALHYCDGAMAPSVLLLK